MQNNENNSPNFYKFATPVNGYTLKNRTVVYINSFHLILLSLLTVGVVTLSSPTISHAQAVNYVDESGNIYFADSIRDVPQRYRYQLVTPTPWPLDKHGKPIIPKKSREQVQAERDRERAKKQAEKMRQREREKIMREQEKRRQSVMRLERRVPQSKINFPANLLPGNSSSAATSSTTANPGSPQK